MKRVLVGGSTGLIGKEFVHSCEELGDEVVRLVRQKDQFKEKILYWDPVKGEIDDINGFDVIVNFAGENIGDSRWNKEKKQRIFDSRIKSTQLISKKILTMKNPPKVWLNASAVGFYGNRGEEPLTEESPRGEGFLAEVCHKWEEASEPVKDKGIRVVNLRTGVVLTPKGGALKQMLPPFQFGLGGRLGTGEQYVSWITLDDLIKAIHFIIGHEGISGPVNLCSPNCIRNIELTKTLGKVLNRPTIVPMPEMMTRLVFGEVADEAFLASTCAIPTKLIRAGFTFDHPNLQEALSGML